MREIKFRGLNRSTRKMVYPEKNCNAPEWFFSTSYNINKIFIVMQFSGLLDKNKKEIYENDILSFVGKKSEVVEVKWRDDGLKCGIKTSDNCTTWYGLSHFLEKYQCKIIGNIYENKDLIKQ